MSDGLFAPSRPRAETHPTPRRRLRLWKKKKTLFFFFLPPPLITDTTWWEVEDKVVVERGGERTHDTQGGPKAKQKICRRASSRMKVINSHSFLRSIYATSCAQTATIHPSGRRRRRRPPKVKIWKKKKNGVCAAATKMVNLWLQTHLLFLAAQKTDRTIGGVSTWRLRQ